MNNRPYAPPLEVEHEWSANETPYPTRVVCVLTFAIAGMTGISVLTDLPSVVSPFPIFPLILREKFDFPIPLISIIAGTVFALVHVRHIAGKPRTKPSIGLTVLLACLTALSVLYFWVDFSVGLEVRGTAHTVLVSGYNATFAIATWAAWIRSRTPGRYRAQLVFGALLFTWMFWCSIPYLGEV